MKQVNIISGVKTFWALKDGIIYHDDNSLMSSEPLIKKVYNKNASNYYREEGKLIEIYNGNRNVYNHKLEKETQVKVADSEIVSRVNDEYFIYTKRIKRKFFENGVVDLEGKVIWSKQEAVRSKGWSDRLMTYCKYLDDEEIFKRDILTGETLWTFNASKIGKFTDYEGEHTGEIRGKIQLWNNYLIVPLTGHKLVSLDYSTGELVWEAIVPFSKYEIYNDKIVCLYESAFQEIDLHTGKTLRDINLNDYLKIGKGIDRISRYKVEKDRIYFTDYRKFKIGILDYYSLELIDLITIDYQKDAWQIGDLEVLDGNIYVLEYLDDFSKNLHIYKDDTL